MRRLFIACLALLALAVPAGAANRMWNPLIVVTPGATSGTGGVCNLKISPSIVGGGLVTGDTVNVTGIGGATGCNVTTTIHVISATNIELDGTTFGGAWTSGGCVAGGHWTATNTANWASSSTATCGSGGQTVPGAADAVTIDANSLASTIIVDAAFTISTLTWGAFPGTLDFSVSNPTVQASSFGGAGTAVRTINCGTATFNMPGSASVTQPWDYSTATNLTSNCGSATFNFTGTSTNTRTFSTGAKIFGTINVTSAVAPTVPFTIALGGGATFTSLNVSGPGYLVMTAGQTLTLTNLSIANATTVNPVLISNGSNSRSTLTVSGTTTINNAALFGLNFTNAATATNSWDMGNNNNVTITPPAKGSGLVSN